MAVAHTDLGAPVYLRDIAEVRDSVQDERIAMRFWARGMATKRKPMRLVRG